MAVVLIGTVSGASPQSITVPAGGVPAKAQIVVFASDAAASVSTPTITDTPGNTYLNNTLQDNNNVIANGSGSITRARTGLALNAGDTITYASVIATSLVNVAAIYITGLLNVTTDGSITGASSDTAPNTGASTPGNPNDVSVSCITSNTTQASMTLAAGWNALPGVVSLTAPALIAGWRNDAASGTVTASGTLGTGAPWAAMLAHYQAYAADMNSQAVMMC